MDEKPVISRPLTSNPGEDSISTTQTANPNPAKKRRATCAIERGNIDHRISDDVLTLVGGVWLIPKTCNSCRERRLFCDRKQPCARCTTGAKECVRPPGLAQAKGFGRRTASNTEPGKRNRIDREEQIPVPPSSSGDENQDRCQASTPVVSDNSSSSRVSPQAADPILEGFVQPACSLLLAHDYLAPITDDIALTTRTTTSRETKCIYESGCPTLALFIEHVRELWELTATERITHIQVMVTVKMYTGPVVRVTDISLDKLSQWDVVMKLAKQNDKMAMVIVEIR